MHGFQRHVWREWIQDVASCRACCHAAVCEWEPGCRADLTGYLLYVLRERLDTQTASVAALHAEWWRLRRERQAEIDASIARHADMEVLVDQPYTDRHRVRVSGAFTMESLSADLAQDDTNHGVTVILDHLRRAGVQNTYRAERLRFETLDPFAGVAIHAVGFANGQRIAVSIGPLNGSVSAEWVRAVVAEAGAAFDQLVICGMAFAPGARDVAASVPLMLARMNPDLAMSDDLLKNTGAGNLFMVFGEPDIAVTVGPDGMVTVELRGLDVFDPTTGDVRTSSTDDIACWFIDTAYDGRMFVVRHAYFTGADEPFDNLKRALRAEVDEAAWASLYSTVSRPFPVPSSGRIAVKVINHYGDEVLKVLDIEIVPHVTETAAAD